MPLAFDLETKFTSLAPLSLSTNPDAPASIEGYAARFGEPDEGGDVIAPGAFVASLARRSSPVKLLWQHDPSVPIGIWDTLREDTAGLFVSGRLITETQAGREAAALLAVGALDGLSIGYRTLRAEKTETGRRLLEVELWEVSLVTFPMNPAARLSPSMPTSTPVSSPAHPSPLQQVEEAASHVFTRLLRRANATLV